PVAPGRVRRGRGRAPGGACHGREKVESGISSVVHPMSSWFWGTGAVTFVEDDAPFSGLLQPPDRRESGDQRALGVANRTGAEGQSAGVEHLDVFGLP